MKIVTRFAPSPTGYLHIGGARTALFNWLFARHHGGEFRLRIEDTDVARSTDDAKRAIIDGLEWLGLGWDGEVVHQMSRSTRHREVTEELVARGQAYYCYASQEELAAQRAAAEAKGEAFRYNRAWRDKTPADAPKDITPVIRIKAPLIGEIVVRDLVQGDVIFGADALDDFIIMRSDGTPTYMHAVVVDDHDMEVTHILRGDDHLNNAGRQSIIYQAMGWDIPHFAHIPLIHGPDGAKLSKRHGALGVEAYRDMGYLPEAMRNYLLRLGWGHGDEELIDTTRAIELFDVSGIGQSPSRMDFAKMDSVNAHYIQLKADSELVEMVAPHFAKDEYLGRALTEAETETLLRVMPSIKPRAKTLWNIITESLFFFARPALQEDAKTTITKFSENIPLIISAFETLTDWNEAAIKQALTDAAVAHEKKLGVLMPPIRAAIVGAMKGPDVPFALEILGKQESLDRLRAVC